MIQRSRCVMGSQLGYLVGINWTTTSWYLGMGTTTAMGLGGALFRSCLVTFKSQDLKKEPIYRTKFGGSLGGRCLNIPYIEHLGKMVLLLMVKEIRLTNQLRLVVFFWFARVFYMWGGCFGFLPSTVSSNGDLVMFNSSSPKTNILANRPKPKRKGLSSNNPFSGSNLLLVSGRVNPYYSLLFQSQFDSHTQSIAVVHLTISERYFRVNLQRSGTKTRLRPKHTFLSETWIPTLHLSPWLTQFFQLYILEF